MLKGAKSNHSGKQKRQAEHIEESYEAKGVKSKEAQKRAWATVNKTTNVGKTSGSGRGKMKSSSSPRKKEHGAITKRKSK